MTILILEDETALQSAIKSKLETEGFEVVAARTVNQALDYLTEGMNIDGVWLDHYLFGKESGLDFVAKLKNNPVWKSLPVFMVSNSASPDTIKSYLDLGVLKYYNKVDYRLDRIVKDIKKVLRAAKP
jgi:DNA-binding response OmpR family regulator